MKKLPYGVSDYERIVDNNYYYVDKTPYIEQLENLAEPYIMLLRPRKFGKTLFTSTLENYYDIKKADKFEKLFNIFSASSSTFTKKSNSYFFANTSIDDATLFLKPFIVEFSSDVSIPEKLNRNMW